MKNVNDFVDLKITKRKFYILLKSLNIVKKHFKLVKILFNEE